MRIVRSSAAVAILVASFAVAAAPLSPAVAPAYTVAEQKAAAEALRGARIFLGIGEKEAVAGQEDEVDRVHWNNSKASLEDVLPKLRFFPRLKSLEMEVHPEITEAGMRDIGKIVTLEKLDLYQTNAAGERLAQLAGLKNLRELHLGQSGITDSRLKQLEPLTSLEYLDLHNNGLTDAAGESLGKFKNLKVLRLSSSGGVMMGIGDKTMEQIKGLEKLTYLDIDGSVVTDAGLEHLTGLKLQAITFGSRITDKGLKSLAKIKTLRSLNAMFPALTDDGVALIAQMPELTRLELSARGITEVGLAHLEKMRKLEHLTIRLEYAKFGNGLKHLSKLPNLRRLDLFPIGGTPFDQFQPLSLGALADCPVLEELWLYNMALDDVATDQILKLKKLKSLVFAPGTTISEANRKRLKEGFPNMRIPESFRG